jgi:hypothetical protein
MKFGEVMEEDQWKKTRKKGKKKGIAASIQLEEKNGGNRKRSVRIPKREFSDKMKRIGEYHGITKKKENLFLLKGKNTYNTILRKYSNYR